MTDSPDTKLCPYCQEEIKTIAKKCKHCGEYLDAALKEANQPQPSTVERMLLPVGRSGWSIAAGYLALIGIVPLLGSPFALGAVVCGFLALREIRQRPTLSGSGRAWFGIILGGICLLMNVGFFAAFMFSK